MKTNDETQGEASQVDRSCSDSSASAGDCNMIMPGPLRACNCFTTRLAARVVSRIYEKHLSAAGLTSTQFPLLVWLGGKQGTTMQEMSSALAMERTTIIRALQPLERDGLIVFSTHAADTRRKVIMLSAAGNEKLAQAMPAWERAQEEFENRFGAGFAQQMRAAMLSLGQVGK